MEDVPKLLLCDLRDGDAPVLPVKDAEVDLVTKAKVEIPQKREFVSVGITESLIEGAIPTENVSEPEDTCGVEEKCDREGETLVLPVSDVEVDLATMPKEEIPQKCEIVSAVITESPRDDAVPTKNVSEAEDTCVVEEKCDCEGETPGFPVEDAEVDLASNQKEEILQKCEIVSAVMTESPRDDTLPTDIVSEPDETCAVEEKCDRDVETRILPAKDAEVDLATKPKEEILQKCEIVSVAMTESPRDDTIPTESVSEPEETCAVEEKCDRDAETRVLPLKDAEVDLATKPKEEIPQKCEIVSVAMTESPRDDTIPTETCAVEEKCDREAETRVLPVEDTEVDLATKPKEEIPQKCEIVSVVMTESPRDDTIPTGNVREAEACAIEAKCDLAEGETPVLPVIDAEIDLATKPKVEMPQKCEIVAAVTIESPTDDANTENNIRVVEEACTPQPEYHNASIRDYEIETAHETSSKPLSAPIEVPVGEVDTKPEILAPMPSKEYEYKCKTDSPSIVDFKPDPPEVDDDRSAPTFRKESTDTHLNIKNEPNEVSSFTKPDPPEFVIMTEVDRDDADNDNDNNVSKETDTDVPVEEKYPSNLETTIHENETVGAVDTVISDEEEKTENSSRHCLHLKHSEDEQLPVSLAAEPTNEEVAKLSESVVCPKISDFAEVAVTESEPELSVCELAVKDDIVASPAKLVSEYPDPESILVDSIISLDIQLSNSMKTTDDDECSYEEIVVDDDDEFLEYVDEILDEEAFTEVTYDSQDQHDLSFIVNGNISRSSNIENHAFNGNTSRSSIGDNSFSKRPVIKSATQKALEQEEARKKAEAKEAEKRVEFRLARQNSFTRKDEVFRKQLEEEEAEHLRQEEEQERKRITEQERLACVKAEQATALIAQQQQEEMRQRLYNDEVRRQAAEAAAHRIAAEEAAREKENAEKNRRKAEETEKLERDAKRKAMEAEVQVLQAKLAEAKHAAEEAKIKQMEEKKRLKSKLEAHRRGKRRASITNPTESEQDVNNPAVLGVEPTVIAVNVESTNDSVAPISNETLTSTGSESTANKVYYSVEQLRKQSVPGLDYKNREIYLHPDEFQKLFGTSISEFNEHPKWKKTQMKRKLKLF
jgi:Villin headpiece domain